LYYRLNVVSVHLPDLTERLEDIPLLADHFVQTFNAQTGRSIKGLSRSGMALLMRHAWPGNVRELENAIEHAFVRCGADVIMPDDLPEALRAGEPAESIVQADDPLRASERSVLEATLKKVNGNKGKAAELLRISRSTLWRKMKRYDLS
jgi:transcriptional regulator with PAS, ATPase and Fis domain